MLGATFGQTSVKRFHLIFSVLPILVTTHPANAAETVLKPVSPWNVEWKDKTCTLARAFGTLENPLVLRMERFAPGDSFQLVLVGKVLAPVRKGRIFSITYGNGEPVDISGTFMFGTSNEGTPTVFVAKASLGNQAKKIARKGEDLWAKEFPKVTPEMEAAVTSISLRFTDQFLRLDTGPLEKAFVALRQCTDDLVRQWGLDPAAQATLQRFPIPLESPGNWIRSSDYPRMAVDDRRSALVTFRLSVDSSGMPTACDIQRAYADTSFETITCSRLMSRARFKPALDFSGAPTPSYYVESIRWVAH